MGDEIMHINWANGADEKCAVYAVWNDGLWPRRYGVIPPCCCNRKPWIQCVEGFAQCNPARRLISSRPPKLILLPWHVPTRSVAASMSKTWKALWRVYSPAARQEGVEYM